MTSVSESFYPSLGVKRRLNEASSLTRSDSENTLFQEVSAAAPVRKLTLRERRKQLQVQKASLLSDSSDSNSSEGTPQGQFLSV
jgi:hypothetical protein